MQLNRSKGTTGFDYQLQRLLGPNAKVVRYPGEGAAAIAKYLKQQEQHGVDVVIAVWHLNELFDKGYKVAKDYPVVMDSLAINLATELKRFPKHLAVVGGSAAPMESRR